jgi:hypothetical protein
MYLGESGMKLFPYVVVALLVLAPVATANAESNWNAIIKTGPETMPLGSLININLTLYAFKISSLAQINDLAFNTSISELTFQAVVTQADEISGYNITVSMPSEILSNSSLIITNSVDGKLNGYSIINDSTIGFYLYAGTHAVTVDICDSPVAAPEFQGTLILTLFMLSLVALAVLKRKLRITLRKE